MPDDDRGRSLKALAAEKTALREENERLARKIAELEARLSKSSQNSSMPPSLDSPGKRAEATKIRAERRAEQKRERQAEVRRRGKQVGAPGQNLPVRENPAEIVTHEPGQCSSCEEDLSGAADEGFEARQVFDVPDPKLICTEHRLVRRRCRCETVMAGGFPPEAKAPTSYGPKLRAATLYLLHGRTCRSSGPRRRSRRCSEPMSRRASSPRSLERPLGGYRASWTSCEDGSVRPG